MDGLFSVFLAVFGFLFGRNATKKLSSIKQIGDRSFFLTISKISFVIAIVSIFSPQSYTDIVTGIYLSLIDRSLCLLKRRRRYAAIIVISIITVVTLWYGLYPINSTGIIVYGVLLVFAWLIVKHEILVDFIMRFLID